LLLENRCLPRPGRWRPAPSVSHPGSTLPSVHEFEIPFALIECGSCDEERPALGSCPHCAAASTEPDPHVAERIKAVEQAREIVQSTDIEPTNMSIESVWATFDGWIDQLFESIGEIANDPSDQVGLTGLANVNLKLAAMKGGLEGVPRLRPTTAIWRAIDRIVESLTQVAKSYAGALVAATPEEAETQAASAQSALDAAAGFAGRASTLANRLQIVEDAGSLPAGLATLAAEAFADVEAQDLIDFDSTGRWLYQRITSRDDCPTGLGVGLNLIWAHAEAGLDPDRFLDAATLTFRILDSGTATITGLIKNTNWRSAFEDASLEMYDAAQELESGLTGAQGSERLEVRAAIRMGALLVERVAQVFLATLMCIEGRRDWRSVESKDVNALLTMTRKAGYCDLLFGIDAALRDADAHGEFCLEDDSVSFTSKRAEYARLDNDELVDHVLGAVESCLAIHTAIVCLMAIHGVPVEDIDTTVLQMTTDQRLTLTMGLSGLTNVHVVTFERPGVVTLRAESGYEVQKPLTILATLHPHFPTGTREVILEIREPSLTFSTVGPVDLLDAWQAEENPFEKEARMIEMLRTFKVNGRPVASKEQTRKWAAVKAAEAVSSDGAVERFRSLEILSRRVRDSKMERCMASLVRLQSSRDDGTPVTHRDRRAPDLIVQWMSQELSTPNQDPH